MYNTILHIITVYICEDDNLVTQAGETGIPVDAQSNCIVVVIAHINAHITAGRSDYQLRVIT